MAPLVPATRPASRRRPAAGRTRPWCRRSRSRRGRAAAAARRRRPTPTPRGAARTTSTSRRRSGRRAPGYVLAALIGPQEPRRSACDQRCVTAVSGPGRSPRCSVSAVTCTALPHPRRSPCSPASPASPCAAAASSSPLAARRLRRLRRRRRRRRRPAVLRRVRGPRRRVDAASRTSSPSSSTPAPRTSCSSSRPGRGDVDDPAVADAGRAVADELAAETFEGLGDDRGPLLLGPAGRQPAGAATTATRPWSSAASPTTTAILVDALRATSPTSTRRDDPDVADRRRVGGFGPLFAEVNETIEADLAPGRDDRHPDHARPAAARVRQRRGRARSPSPSAPCRSSARSSCCSSSTSSPRCRCSPSTSRRRWGSGLAIDYSLFIVSRYREELQRRARAARRRPPHRPHRGQDRALQRRHRGRVALRAARVQHRLPAQLRLRRSGRLRSSPASTPSSCCRRCSPPSAAASTR